MGHQGRGGVIKVGVGLQGRGGSQGRGGLQDKESVIKIGGGSSKQGVGH